MLTAKNILKTTYLVLSAIRLLPHIFLMKYHPSRQCISQDIEQWSIHCSLGPKSETSIGTVWYFIRLMTFLPEYRSVFYYRLGWAGRIIYPLCRPSSTPFFGKVEEGIGPGLFVLHGWATSIAAWKIGKNCSVYQHVTIGYLNPNEKPTIGDNVTISAGAKVLGNITIGHNSIIGANAVVIKDVPENCIVVGVPAYIVRRNGIKVKEPL